MAGTNCAASFPLSDARGYSLALSRAWLTRRKPLRIRTRSPHSIAYKPLHS